MTTFSPSGGAVPSKKRFLPTTLFGGVVLLGGLVLTPISLISLTMILVGSYGTKTSDPMGFFLVVIAPPLAFLTGIGLIFRWRWAWFVLVVALLGVLGWQAVEYRRPPAGPPTTTISPSGVRMMVYPDQPDFSLPLVLGCLAVLGMALTPWVRRDFFKAGATPRPATDLPPPLPGIPPVVQEAAAPRQDASGWRVGHRGRDQMFYEENVDGAWQRIDIDGEMLTGRAHHVIYFASPEAWQQLPAWARDRREEIIARIQSEFREPDYEYAGCGGVAPVAHAGAGGFVHAGTSAITPSQRWALLAALVCLLGLAGWMGWWVKQGLATGKVPYPTNKPSLRRSVVRENEPALYWVCMGLYGAVGTGALGLIAWGAKQTGFRRR